LWKIAGLGGNVSVQVAMSAYLIGIDWEYWIFWENDCPDAWAFFSVIPDFHECCGARRLKLLMIDVTDYKDL